MAPKAPTAWQRFQEAPRAMHWLAAAVMLLVVFLVWDETKTYAEKLDGRADAMQRKVEKVHDADSLITNLKLMGELVGSVGAVERPADEKVTSHDLTAAVNDVLERFSISSDTIEYSNGPGQRLPKSVLRDLTGGKALETWRADLRFDASPSVATSVIAALEADPAIERVQQLTISKSGTSDVKVRLVLEAWVLIGGRS